MERPVEVLADLLEDGGADLREPDLALARLGKATFEARSAGRINGSYEESNRGEDG